MSLGIVYIHGVNDQETGYSNRLHDMIGCGRQYEILWADITHTMTREYIRLQYSDRKQHWSKIGKALKPLVGQVLYYVHDKSHNSEILFRIHRQIQNAVLLGDELIIIAHSLGSVIAFDYLFGFKEDKLSPQAKIKAFITMGSPIGLFISHMGYAKSDIKLPKNIGSWVNILDYDDQIADRLEPHLNCVKDIPVNTGLFMVQSHSSYWKNKQVAKVIRSLIDNDNR